MYELQHLTRLLSPCALKSPAQQSGGILLEGAVAHTTRGRNRRQKCRERSYYHLHRNLYNPLLHKLRFFFQPRITRIKLIYFFVRSK